MNEVSQPHRAYRDQPVAATVIRVALHVEPDVGILEVGRRNAVLVLFDASFVFVNDSPFLVEAVPVVGAAKGCDQLCCLI